MRLGLLFAVLVALCCGCCCCGRVPMFGLGPEVDTEAIRHDVLARADVVDHLCGTELHCRAVVAADVDVLASTWNPVTDTVVTTIAVEATCRASVQDTGEVFVCAGALAAVGTVVGGVVVHEMVTDSVGLGLPQTHPRDWDPPSRPHHHHREHDWDFDD
jgi:hypothetical protein